MDGGGKEARGGPGSPRGQKGADDHTPCPLSPGECCCFKAEGLLSL